MKRIGKYISILSLVLICSLPNQEVTAQCPMCRMSAESNLKNGGTAGQGLNKGILYMLALPYVMVATLGYIWWRNQRPEEEDEDSFDNREMAPVEY